MDPQFSDPAQQEVWQTLRALNDAWTKGNPAELQNYFHEDMVAITPTNARRLEGRQACVAAWSDFARSHQISTWVEREPHVQVYDRTAIVTYFYDLRAIRDGRPLTFCGRDMLVFIQQHGKWWVVADQFSANPQ